MLKQRVATAAVLLGFFLIAVFLFPTSWFAVVMLAFVLAGAAEWWRLCGLERSWKEVASLSAMTAILVLAWWFRDSSALFIAAAGTLWWLLALTSLWWFPATESAIGIKVLSGVAVLVPAWGSLVYLHQTNLSLLVALFLVVWLSDSGAFFAGRRWGRRKLAPVISPGKTIEGMVGGIVATVVFAVVSSAWIGADIACGLLWMGVCVLASLACVVGDLWESKMKRAANVKDSGSLLPGHGGVLDRIDSVTAAAPVFVVALHLIGQAFPKCAELMYE